MKLCYLFRLFFILFFIFEIVFFLSSKYRLIYFFFWYDFVLGLNLVYFRFFRFRLIFLVFIQNNNSFFNKYVIVIECVFFDCRLNIYFGIKNVEFFIQVVFKYVLFGCVFFQQWRFNKLLDFLNVKNYCFRIIFFLICIDVMLFIYWIIYFLSIYCYNFLRLRMQEEYIYVKENVVRQWKLFVQFRSKIRRRDVDL